MSIQSLLFPKPPIYFLQYIELPAQTATEVLTYDLDGLLKHYRRFSPFTNFQLVNNSSIEFEVRFDYSVNKRIKILGGAVKAVKNQPFNSFQILNLSGVTSEAGKVTIELETIR